MALCLNAPPILNERERKLVKLFVELQLLKLVLGVRSKIVCTVGLPDE
jgi:hypothetical protein